MNGSVLHVFEPKGKPRPPWENQPPATYTTPLPPPHAAVPAPAMLPVGAPDSPNAAAQGQRRLAIAAACVAILVLLGALSGGIGGALVLGGLAVVTVGAVA